MLKGKIQCDGNGLMPPGARRTYMSRRESLSDGRVVMSRATTAALLKAIQTAQAGGVSDADLLRRFSDDDDQAAFETLLRRHGGMVLGVCRRVLPNQQDAEDACQATFLILARKARGHDRWQASVANWLYATARKVSRNARLAAQRRARREARAAVSEVVQAVDGMSGRELLAALDEELGRLPPRYREPLVLCYLEGLTRDEAAVRLGVPAGTIKIQLERGRKRLGAALMGRGCALGAGLLTLAATSPAGASQPGVFEDVLAAIAGSPRGAVAKLLKGVAVQAALKKSMIAALILLGVSALSFGASFLMTSGATPPDDRAMPARSDARPAVAERPAPEPMMDVSGQVLDPQGRPFHGARLVLVGRGQKPEDLGTSGADGRFTVKVPRETAEPTRFLAACASGAGIDFAAIAGLNPARAVELRLVEDHVIRGKIVDTQGKPVAGVQVAVTTVGAFDGNSVDRFLSAWTNRMFSYQWPEADRNLWQEGGAIAPATTDAEGRFTLAGTGAERVVHLHTSGAGSAAADWRVVNRPGFNATPYNETARKQSPIIVSGSGHPPAPVLHGPEPVFVVDPGKVARGVVRDAGTGKPWPGVEVHCHGNSATTDAAGRYEIRGVPKDNSYWLRVNADLSAGLLGQRVTVPDTDGYAPVAADIAVTRVTQTAVINGRLIDAATGKGIRGDIHVAALAGNAFARMLPSLLQRLLCLQHVNRGGRHLPDRDHPRPRIAHGRRGLPMVARGTGVSLAQVQAGDGRPRVSSVFPGRAIPEPTPQPTADSQVCREALARSSRSNRARRSSRTLPWSPQVRSRSRSRTPPAARSPTPSSGEDGRLSMAIRFARKPIHGWPRVWPSQANRGACSSTNPARSCSPRSRSRATRKGLWSCGCAPVALFGEPSLTGPASL